MVDQNFEHRNYWSKLVEDDMFVYYDKNNCVGRDLWYRYNNEEKTYIYTADWKVDRSLAYQAIKRIRNIYDSKSVIKILYYDEHKKIKK